MGLAPYAKESGQYKSRRSIFAERNNLRKVLYMAAVDSLRCNKQLRSFFFRNAMVNQACKRLVLQNNIPREEVCNLFIIIILGGS